MVSGCQFSNTIGEAIYMGRYNDLSDGVPGIIVESNLCVNTGQPGHEGDIDIKPPCYGAIVRYNQNYHTAHDASGDTTFCGVVIAANACEVYGNIFHGAETNSNGGWGCGVYLTSDGDASTGKPITSCLIYNNLIYDCEQTGIKIGATTTTSGADVSGVKIWNNTIATNWTDGIAIGASGSRTITIAEMKNNVVVSNGNYDVELSGTVTLSACDYNLYSRKSGNGWYSGGAGKSWAQWQALGYDAHGMNADPALVGGGNYALQATSPAKDAGVTIASFSTDILGTSRPQGSAWDIGAYEYNAQEGGGTNATPAHHTFGNGRVGTLRVQ